MGNAKNAKAKNRGSASEYQCRETVSEYITESSFNIEKYDHMN